MKNINKLHVSAVLLIVVFGGMLYGNTLDNEFIYNDFQMVGDNSFIRSPGNLRYFFADKYFVGSREGTYRPLVTLTLFADHTLWKDDPFGYHLTNLIIHVLNAVLFYFLLAFFIPFFAKRNFGIDEKKSVLSNLTLPLLCALFFISHPVETEGAVSIGSRHDAVMSLFYFAALIFYLKSRRSGGGRASLLYFLSLISYFLSMTAKEMGITLPAIIILMDLVYSPQQQLPADKARQFAKSIKYYTGYVLVALLYLYIRLFGMVHPAETISQYYSSGSLLGGNYYTHILTAICALGTYLRLLFFPFRLSLEYPVEPVFSALDPRVIASVVMLTAVILLALRCRRRRPMVFFGWAWFFITLVPVSNIFILLASTRISERFLYLPAAGYSIFLAGALYGISRYGEGRPFYQGLRKTVILIAGLILCLYSVRTVTRNMEWQDSRTVWEAAAQTEYKSFRTHNNLAMVYYYGGDAAKAIAELETSLRLDDNAHTRVNLGFIYFEQGKYEQAEKEFKTAVNRQPGYAPAYYHLALVSLKDGHNDRAIELLREALEKYENIKERPFYAETHNAMGMALYRGGDPERSVDAFKKALVLKPDYTEARYNLAMSYYANGAPEKAEEEYAAVLLAEPSHVNARNNLANIYYSRGLIEEAACEYRKILEAAPSHFHARNNLANIYLSRRSYDEAISEYRKALEVQPDNAVVHYNLALAYEGKGRFREAQREWEEALRIDPGFAPAKEAIKEFTGKGVNREQ